MSFAGVLTHIQFTLQKSNVSRRKKDMIFLEHFSLKTFAYGGFPSHNLMKPDPSLDPDFCSWDTQKFQLRGNFFRLKGALKPLSRVLA